jgi:hypothetical protein
MMIASHVEGRLRVRGDELKDSSLVRGVRDKLLARDGLLEVLANLKTGSLLIFYDPSPGVKEGVLHTLTPYLQKLAEGPSPKTGTSILARLPNLPNRRRVVHLGMLSSLGVSLLAAVLDQKKLHILTGIAWLVFLGFHLSGKKRILFPRKRPRDQSSASSRAFRTGSPSSILLKRS